MKTKTYYQIQYNFLVEKKRWINMDLYEDYDVSLSILRHLREKAVPWNQDKKFRVKKVKIEEISSRVLDV